MSAKRKKPKLCNCGRKAGMLPETGEQICKRCWIKRYVLGRV